MKKLLTISLLLMVLLLLGCTADSLQTANVEAAESVVVERPTEDTAELPTFPLKSCPVTQPPQERFIPPEPYHEYPALGYFWHGSDELWTKVPNNHTMPLGEKVTFWRHDYYWLDEPEPALIVSAQRLDADAPPATVGRATNGWNPDTESFMLVGVEFPTGGCWELTAEYGEDVLSFVIWVAP